MRVQGRPVDRHQLYKAETISGRQEGGAFPTRQWANEKQAASADTRETGHRCVRPVALDNVNDKMNKAEDGRVQRVSAERLKLI